MNFSKAKGHQDTKGLLLGLLFILLKPLTYDQVIRRRRDKEVEAGKTVV